MKKKKNSKAENSNNKNNFADLGIEPPKIYREAQKSVIARQEQSRVKKSTDKQSISRSEKRELDNKKRKKRNTLRRALIWLIALITFAAVGTVLSLTVFFNITEITVSGNERYGTDEILSQCSVDVGENLFLADIKGAKEMLERNLPYIYSAQIKRSLPYKIEINIIEAQPAYCIKNEDKTYILLDDNFKVLETNAKKASGIVILKAETGSAVAGNVIEFADEEISTCLENMAAVIKNNAFTEITAIYSLAYDDNYVVYDKRITFKLGSCDDIENKIYKGLASCEQLNESSPNVSGTMDISGGKSIYFTEK